MHSRLKIIIFALLLALIAGQTSTYNSFLQFKKQHKKTYVDQTEELYRFYVYNKNLQIINNHNSDPARTHEMGVNQFTDLTLEELKLIYLTLLPPSDTVSVEDNEEDENENQDEPDEHPNWGKKLTQDDQEDSNDDHPIVGQTCTPAANPTTWQNKTSTNPFPVRVLNQGSCGSCYAFASAELMSTMISIQKLANFTFSPQQIVDCDTYDNGCGGGWPTNVFIYARSVYIANLTIYPYSGVRSTCRATSTSTTIKGPYRVLNYTYTNTGNNVTNCAALLAKIQKSPMVVGLDATDLFGYKSGALNSTKTNPNHAVLLVGVDSCNNWIIQNSWGTTWGLSGLARLTPGNSAGICICGGWNVTMA